MTPEDAARGLLLIDELGHLEHQNDWTDYTDLSKQNFCQNGIKVW